MIKTVYLAGGCFWGVEAFFKQLLGVKSTKTCYVNGGYEGVDYKTVCKGSDHAEAIELVYDDEILSENIIWEAFLTIIDPYSYHQQGNDKGSQYRTGVYTNDAKLLNKFKKYNVKFIESEGKQNFIEFLPVTDVTIAEDYHQDYLGKNPLGYCHVDLNSGKEEWKKRG
ncbi:peptide-methionine (S)-S-oxide reductase MsrA [Mycoplasmopsis opalescens]|uniref:peptide-methionine (S)-S-oxide reductase MsrA n=1 Tax=Mycoplasmopsis opalescens TaxID=114886 RepID=UPI0004A6D945|nr:peptide-methionine (S)-S-oxide reductase MsrA [Mycoplasmopsis opalescens]